MLQAGRTLLKFRHCASFSSAPSAAAALSTCDRIGRNTAPLGMGAYNLLAFGKGERASACKSSLKSELPLANRVSKARLNFAAGLHYY
jgi:hypothetical protein